MPIGLPTPYGGLLTPTQGYGGGFQGFSPLTQFGLGLLAQSGPSLTPQSPFAAIGKAGTYASEQYSQAQQQAMQNELIRAKLAENARATKSQEALQQYISGAKEELIPGIPNAVTAAGLANDPTAFSKFIPQAQTEEQKLQYLQTQAQILKLQQDLGAGSAETTTPGGAVVRSTETLADTFDAIEKSPGGNPFAPGAMFYKDAPLGKLGVTADSVLGLPDAVLSQWGDPATIRAQAQQAQLIDKETATISRGLQQLAQQGGGGKSATAIEQMQTSLGEGNIGIPVRRKVIASTLDTVIDDFEAKGLEVPQHWYALRDRLKEQTKNVGKDVPAAEAPTGFNPMNLLPESMQPSTSTAITPQPGVPFRVSPPTEAPPGTAPTPRKTGTLRLNAQGVPAFNRFADVKRAEAQGLLQGATSIEVGGKIYDWVQ